MSSTADVVVVGGGIVGTSTAFHLASRGVKRVILCERRFLAAGATGKSGALVRMHYANEPEARLAFASLPYFHRWDELVGYGSCGFIKTGMLRIVSPTNAAKLTANVEMLRRVGIDTTVLGPEEVRRVAPDWHVADITAAAYEPESGCADAVATTYNLAARARQLGVEVQVDTEVTGMTTAGGLVKGVTTNRGPISTPAVVVAGGAWSIPLLNEMGLSLPLEAVRTQVVIFQRPPDHGGLHPICSDGINDIWLRPEGPNWGSTLVGLGQWETVTNPDELDEGVDREYAGRARQPLARRIPAMAHASMRGGWAGVITATPDRKPIIDRHPQIDGFWFFAGDSGSSFKTAPAIGQALAEWVTTGKPRVVDLRPFRASRFAEGQWLMGEHEYDDRTSDPTEPPKVRLG